MRPRAASPNAGRVSGTSGPANRGARTHVPGAIRTRAKAAGPNGAGAGVTGTIIARAIGAARAADVGCSRSYGALGCWYVSCATTNADFARVRQLPQ
jgi:hypothetical protein